MHVKPVRYQNQRCLHFITFSCYHRMPLLDSSTAKETFEQTLERVRV
jgi:putative transposase